MMIFSREAVDLPSLGRPLFSHSVRWRTKSKKKSPSGTLMTLSLILTNSEKPSAFFSPSRSEMVTQKSFDLVLESTSKAWLLSSGKKTLW